MLRFDNADPAYIHQGDYIACESEDSSRLEFVRVSSIGRVVGTYNFGLADGRVITVSPSITIPTIHTEYGF